MNSSDTRHNYGNSMPQQKLSSRKKTKEWGKACVRAVANQGKSSRDLNGRTRWERKQINYDLVNSIIREDDFKHVINPYGSEKVSSSQPAKLRDINLVFNKLNLMRGEEMARPFNFHVMATNGEAVTIKEEKKKEMIMSAAKYQLYEAAGLSPEPSIDPETGEEVPPVPLPQIEKYMSSSYTDIRERWANDILSYIEKDQDLALKFNEGWEHGLISAEEVFYVGKVNGRVVVRVVNPLNSDFDRNPDNPKIEDGDWFKEDRSMTVGQILDEFQDKLTDDQITRLDTGNMQFNANQNMHPGFAYTEDSIKAYSRNSHSDRGTAQNTHIQVTTVVWKSMKKLGTLKYLDQNGEFQENFVDDTFKLTPEMKEQGMSVKWRWIPQVWQGTKISEDIIVDVKPIDTSIDPDNPSACKLPYVGRVLNGTNSVQTSMVDLIKPHQYLYCVVWFRLEAELAKAKGKKFLMDMALLPKSQGFDMEKWMYMFDNVGLALVNSFETGKGQFSDKTSAFNQFQAIDMTLSQSIGQYIQILDRIEGEIDRMLGITPQREGQVQASESATATRAAQVNSSYVTEPWFYMHNQVKKEVLTQCLNVAKFAYEGTKKINYIVDDVQRVMTQIDMDKFCDSYYGLFVTNSSKDNRLFDKIEALAPMLAQGDKARFSDLIAMYESNSIAEFKNRIEDAELQAEQKAQAAQEAQQQSEQQAMEMEAQKEKDQRDWQSNENQLDRDSDIQKTVISAVGFNASDESGDGTVDDIIKQGDLALKQMDSERKHIQEDRKINLDRESKSKELDFKNRELKAKERMNKDNNRTALKNKVVGEKKTPKK